jgi:hypothetical protein
MADHSSESHPPGALRDGNLLFQRDFVRAVLGDED